MCLRRELDVEFEEEDIAVFDDVFFAFGAEEAFFFYGLLAAVFEEVVAGIAVGFDEALFEVGVDYTCGAGGFGAGTGGGRIYFSRETFGRKPAPSWKNYTSDLLATQPAAPRPALVRFSAGVL